MDIALNEQPLVAPEAERLLDAFAAETAGLYPGWSPDVGPSAAAEDFAAPAGTFLVAYAGGGRLAHPPPQEASSSTAARSKSPWSVPRP